MYEIIDRIRTWSYRNKFISAVSSEQPFLRRIGPECISRSPDRKVSVKMSVNIIDRLHSVDVSENKDRLLVVLFSRSDVIVKNLLASRTVIHAGKRISHVDLLKFFVNTVRKDMAAHTEKLGIHILNESA